LQFSHDFNDLLGICAKKVMRPNLLKANGEVRHFGYERKDNNVRLWNVENRSVLVKAAD
jgi:hypothetical protein